MTIIAKKGYNHLNWVICNEMRCGQSISWSLTPWHSCLAQILRGTSRRYTVRIKAPKTLRRAQQLV
jgi:hypothetical protein